MEPQSQPQTPPQTQVEPQIAPIAPVAAAQPQAPIPTKPMISGCGELLSRMFKIYKQSYKVFFKIGSIPFLLVLVLIAVCAFTMYRIGFQSIFSTHTPSFGFLIGIWGVELIVIIFLVLVKTVMILQLKQAETQVPASVNSLFAQGLKFFLPLIGLGILWYLIYATGLLLFIIPGVALVVYLLFYGYAVVLDGKKGFQAFNASWYYVKGYWWAVFGRLMFAALMLIVLEIALWIVGIILGIIFVSLL